MILRPRTRRPKDQLNVCQDCGVVLSDENWTASQQKYGRYICAPCWSARQRRYEKTRRESIPDLLERRRDAARERRAEWSEDRKEQDRRRTYSNWLKRNYGISIEDFDAMYEEQEGKCKICGSEKPKGRGGFHVDHCHQSGAVRGLLCTSCNMMLGLASDDIGTLRNAIRYLQAANDNPPPRNEETA